MDDSLFSTEASHTLKQSINVNWTLKFLDYKLFAEKNAFFPVKNPKSLEASLKRTK